MSKFIEKIKHLNEEQKKTVKIYGIGFLSGIAFFSVLLVLVSSFSRFHDFRDQRMMSQGCMQDGIPQGLGVIGPGPNGKGPNLEGKRLFEKFCLEGKIISGDIFKEKFGKNAQQRFQKTDMIRKNLDMIIMNAKKNGKDTLKLESMIKEVDDLLSGFRGGKEDFMMNPQHFCDNTPQREQINIQMREKMLEIGKEIDNLRK